MNFTRFIIKFAAGAIHVRALNREEAKILAQAEAIKRGWDYPIIGVEDEQTFFTYYSVDSGKL